VKHLLTTGISVLLYLEISKPGKKLPILIDFTKRKMGLLDKKLK